jgi:hypothetical protein
MRKQLLTSAIVFSLLFAPCRAQNVEHDAAKAIETELAASKGIVVGEPKVYDDSVLQQMLSSAEAQLASLQVLSQSGISANFGAITGANQHISSFALSAQVGPPSATTAITDNGATTQVANTATPGGTGNSSVTTTAAPVQNTTTTLSPPSGAIATSPAPSTNLPTTFGVSASDILHEQMQVTFEIANLRLLLEGSLSDRILKGNNGKTFLKPRTTVGFPIAIMPDNRFKDAAAVVEVEIEAEDNLSTDNQPPTITALLPRDKTYNVAAIKDNSSSFGGGVATQLVGVSAAFLTGHKSYYLVKDQDTVALTLPVTTDPRTGKKVTRFIWEFRPVLGQAYVQAGLKQTFVQLSFPSDKSAEILGHVHVSTYWRKVAPTDAEDLGNGQMLVTVLGRFLDGTYVRVGSNILQAGSAGFTSEYQQIRFVASISDLATKKVTVVTRDGTSVNLKVNANSTPYNPETNPIHITGATITAIDESNSLLVVETDPVCTSPILPLVFVIGGKVFGYTDAPIRRDPVHLSAVLPTSFLIANPEVTVKPLFVDDKYFDKWRMFDVGTEIERLVLVQQDTKTVTYLLFGRELAKIMAVAPTGTTLKPVGNGHADDVLRQIEVTTEVAKSLKQIVFQRPHQRPFVVSVPALPTTDQATQAAEVPGTSYRRRLSSCHRRR